MNVSGFRSRTRRKSISISASWPSNLWENDDSDPPFRQAIDELEADIVPCPLVLAARVAQADHQFHRRQRRGSRTRCPGRTRGMTGPAGADPARSRPRINQSSLSFSLRSGLMTSG